MDHNNKPWSEAQDYELRYTLEWLASPNAPICLAKYHKVYEEKLYALNSPMHMKEFFQDDEVLLGEFIDYTTNKNCLEIGCSCVPLINSFWWAKRNFLIEPLLPHLKNYCPDVFEHTVNYGQSAGIKIPELVGQIDGAVVCRNCLDHTPEWAGILSNIREYTQRGAYLLLWNDIYHPFGSDAGHYNITPNVDNWKKGIADLGFRMEREVQSIDHETRKTISYGCVGRKI